MLVFTFTPAYNAKTNNLCMRARLTENRRPGTRRFASAPSLRLRVVIPRIARPQRRSGESAMSLRRIHCRSASHFSDNYPKPSPWLRSTPRLLRANCRGVLVCALCFLSSASGRRFDRATAVRLLMGAGRPPCSSRIRLQLCPSPCVLRNGSQPCAGASLPRPLPGRLEDSPMSLIE